MRGRGRSVRSTRSSAPVASKAPAGDLFASVYDNWFGKVRQWTRALAADSCDADDLAQNVFLIVHRRLREFDGRNLGGWLYTITANQVRDHRRRMWIRTRTDDSEAALAEMESTDPTPAALLETGEQIEALSEIVARLGAGSRATFLLFTLDQYTSKEIAAMQRVSLNTVLCRIRRSRNTVVNQMAEWAAPAASSPARQRAGWSG
jgi:RNA polymerase sigma-70 factor, ECF subfamily